MILSTHGDGLADLNINNLIKSHKKSKANDYNCCLLLVDGEI